MRLCFPSRMHISSVMSTAAAQNAPRHWLHSAAGAAVVVVLAIVVSSAYLRQASIRFNCSDWPACAQHVTGEDPARARPTAERVARLVHRLSASIAGVLVLLIAYLSSVQQPRIRTDIALSAALVILTVFLAILGRWSRNSQGPLVTLGNLLGGMTLLVLLHWMRLRTSPARAARDGAGRLASVAGAALALAIADVSLGALMSSSHGESAVRAASVSPLAVAHLLSGVLLLLLTGTLALHPAARGRCRRTGAIALTLTLAQAITGWISVSFGYPLVSTLAHNLLAALLLIALATAADRCIGSSHAQAVPNPLQSQD